MGSFGVAELLHHAAHRVGGGRACIRDAGGVVQQVLDLLQQTDRHAQAAGDQIAPQIGARPLVSGGLGRCRDQLGIERLGLDHVAVEVEELQAQLHTAFAIDDGVVHLLDEGALAAAQAIDDDELPQRPGAVERVAGDEAGQIEQLAHGARLG